MFLTLLAVTFGIAAVVSVIVARLFDRPLRQILSRLVQEELSTPTDGRSRSSRP
jgi:hypothetical protein